MNNMSTERTHPYNIRNGTNLQAFSVKHDKIRYDTIRYKTISFRSPKNLETRVTHIKEFTTLNKFKSCIKERKPVGCTCRLCKTYIDGQGFL